MTQSLSERLVDLERDILALQHVDRDQEGRLTALKVQLAELKATADQTLAAVGELSQDMHGVDARLTVLERDVAEVKRDVAEVKRDVAEVKHVLSEHGEMLRAILDRLPAPSEG